MLDAPQELLMNRIPDEAEAQKTCQELGNQSAAGWASGMSASDIPLGPWRTSAKCRAGNSQTQSEDTGSTQGSTFVEDDATVSSLGDPEGTYDLGGPTDKSEAMRQAHQDGTLPTNEPWNHALRRNQPIGDAMMIPKPGGRKKDSILHAEPQWHSSDLGREMEGKLQAPKRHGSGLDGLQGK